MLALLIQGLFLYFSSFTYLFLTKTFLTNPGYLPRWLKVPMSQDGTAPYRVVRVYNMRFWMANKIHSFEEFLTPSDEENIEISLNESTGQMQSAAMSQRNNNQQ